MKMDREAGGTRVAIHYFCEKSRFFTLERENFERKSCSICGCVPLTSKESVWYIFGGENALIHSKILQISNHEISEPSKLRFNVYI